MDLLLGVAPPNFMTLPFALPDSDRNSAVAVFRPGVFRFHRLVRPRPLLWMRNDIDDVIDIVPNEKIKGPDF
jgi:hypothetical protein